MTQFLTYNTWVFGTVDEGDQLSDPNSDAGVCLLAKSLHKIPYAEYHYLMHQMAVPCDI